MIGHVLLYQLCPFDGNLLDLLPVLVEHHLSLKSGSRIVDMDDRPFYTADGLKGPPDQVLPALGENLNCHVIRDQLSLHKLP